MITAWRITSADLASNAFSGWGAREYGGRWNHPGTPLVYTAQSQALAALELFVHIKDEYAALDLVLIPVGIPAAVKIKKVPRSRLTRGWDSHPPGDASMDLGTRWAQSAATAVLRVPSVMAPDEYNYLLNPLHPDFAKLKIGDPKPFSFDPRMFN